MRSTVFAACALVTAVLAQNRASGWINPSSDSPNFSVTSTIGEEITFSWNALNQSLNHLYLVPWDQSHSSFGRMLAANIDISIPGEYKWVNDVGRAALTTGRQFRLLFWPAESLYSGPLPGQIVSPGFVVAGAPKTTPAGGSGTTATASSSSPTSSSASPSSTSSTAATTQNDSGSSSQDKDKKEGLSIAAQAGLGVGVSIGAILLLAIAYYLGRRQRRQPLNANYVSVNSMSNLNFRSRDVKGSDIREELATASPVYNPHAEAEWDRHIARGLPPPKFELPGSSVNSPHQKT